MNAPIDNLSAPIQQGTLILSNRVTGVIATQTLDRSASSLAENVQQAMDAIYVLQKSVISGNATPRVLCIQVQTGKDRFRTECENMRKMLQASFRHAVDFAMSSQRHDNDCSLAMKACHLSAQGVFRDIQKITKVFEGIIIGFKKDRVPLEVERSGATPSQEYCTPTCEFDRVWSTFENVQSSLRDIRAFWGDHVHFLTLIVNGQANLPGPGEESKQIMELWTKYQAALLEAINSISESADGLSVTPQAVLPDTSETAPLHRIASI